jgi:rod shape determining protein RodA
MSWREISRRWDPWMVVVALALAAYGGLIIYSASLSAFPDGVTGLDHPVVKQGLAVALGLTLMVAVMAVPFRVWALAAPVLYGLTLVLLVMVLLVGQASLGARRWLDLGLVQVQVSEMAKLATVIVLARFLSQRWREMGKVGNLLLSLGLAAVPALLVMVEPDLGTAIIFGVVWVVMALIGGARPSHVGMVVALVLLSIPLTVAVALADYQRERLALFFNPNLDPLGGGFNILQAEIGIGAGGLWGRGLFQGTQTQLDFLQAASTDYAFAVLGEELGLMGALFLLALYAFLLFRLIRAAALAHDLFARLLVIGLAVTLLTQVFINIGVNVRLLPVTGIPLPLVSQGGTSTVITMVALGIAQGVLLRRAPFNL